MPQRIDRVLMVVFLFIFFAIQACSMAAGRYSNDMDAVTPHRTLRILVASDGAYGRKAIEQHISRASRVFEDQFGIRLEPAEYVPISWGNWADRDVEKMLHKLYAASRGHDFDISIGYAELTAGEAFARYLIGGWDGAIDDTWRRFIIVRDLEDHTILHELCHAFIFSEEHSGFGLMSPMTIQLIPFIPVNLSSNRLDQRLRSEVLKNKWRDFTKAVALPERMDPIAIREEVRKDP